MNSNYKIYIDEKNKRVIAICRYAGRKIKTIAKCHPDDVFDIEYGTKLAIARGEYKVAKIKIKNASNKYLEAAKMADEAERKYDAMKQYYMDSVDLLDKAQAAVDNLIKEIM